MSSFRTYVMLLFGISVILYLMGYSAPIMNLNTETDLTQALLNSFLGVFTNPTFLAILGISAVASFLAGGSNFSVTYLIPILLIQAMLNFFVLPTSFILSMEVDPLIKMVVGGFLNLLLALSILEFTRGMG